MAATVVFDGTVIDTADTAANWTAVKITAGGGGPTAVATGLPYEGTDNVTCRSDNKRVYMYTDIGAGNELDFTGGGAEEGNMVYIWVNFLASPLLNTQAGGGLGVFLESSTPSSSQYHLWYFHGRDSYTGGWLRLVLDPNETVSASAGTAIDLTAIRYFGAFAHNNQAAAKYDNFIVDQCAYGKGLIVTGTSTADALVADLIADENTNRHGIVIPLNSSETAVELNGSLTLGDVTAATNSTLSDVSAKIFLAEPIYYDGTSLTNSVPTDYFAINAVGGTGTNSIIIGKAVGTEGGRSGWTVVGNDTYNLSMDFDNGSVNTSEWYGCIFENITGTLSWGTNTAHKCFTNQFIGCEEFDPVGGVEIKNCTFANVFNDGTADASNRSALLWNDSIDIESCSFLANSHTGTDVAHGIRHTSTTGDATGTVTTADATGVTLTDSAASFLTTAAVNDIVFNETDGSDAKVVSITSNVALVTDGLTGGTGDDFASSDAYSVVTPISYVDLTFSGNEKDIHNNKAGGNGLAVTNSGTSNPTTFTGQADVRGSVSVLFTMIDNADGADIQNVRVSAYLISDDSEIVNELTDVNGEVSLTYTGTTPANIYYKCKKSSTGDTKYVALSGTGTIESGTGLTVSRRMAEDTIADTSI